MLFRSVYTLNGSNFSLQYGYTVAYEYQGQFSLMNFIDDVKAFSSAGFNDFTRLLISFIIIVLTVASLYKPTETFLGTDKEKSILLLITFMAWALSFLGMMTLNIAGISDPYLQQYALVILLTLYTFAEILRGMQSG